MPKPPAPPGQQIQEATVATINEGLYCQVDPGNPVAVDDRPRRMPQNWTSPYETQPNGRPVEYLNINNSDVWNDAALLSIGWYPYVLVDSPPAQYPEYYDKALDPFNIQATEVTQTVVYTQWDIDRVKTRKINELNGQVTFFEANQLAVDRLLEETATNENEWVNVQGAQVSRLSSEGDWNAVAAFDTTKPLVITLPNNYVGQSYVNQGVRMTAENDAATQATLAPPYDAQAVADFITANKIAAEDASGTQPPTEPTYELRQGVVTPADGVSEVWNYRESRDDPNPALQTTYKMRLLNKQDTRPLYIFSYTGLDSQTYLTWRLFEIQSDGSYALEATSAEWQYAPGDMSFIFSYGTNPAVEADFFTLPVNFPAGVAEQVIRVRWDQQ